MEELFALLRVQNPLKKLKKSWLSMWLKYDLTFKDLIAYKSSKIKLLLLNLQESIRYDFFTVG